MLRLSLTVPWGTHVVPRCPLRDSRPLPQARLSSGLTGLRVGEERLRMVWHCDTIPPETERLPGEMCDWLGPGLPIGYIGRLSIPETRISVSQVSLLSLQSLVVPQSLAPVSGAVRLSPTWKTFWECHKSQSHYDPYTLLTARQLDFPRLRLPGDLVRLSRDFLLASLLSNPETPWDWDFAYSDWSNKLWLLKHLSNELWHDCLSCVPPVSLRFFWQILLGLSLFCQLVSETYILIFTSFTFSSHQGGLPSHHFLDICHVKHFGGGGLFDPWTKIFTFYSSLNGAKFFLGIWRRIFWPES